MWEPWEEGAKPWVPKRRGSGWKGLLEEVTFKLRLEGKKMQVSSKIFSEGRASLRDKGLLIKREKLA